MTELDYSKLTLIDDLINKSHHSIQIQLSTGQNFSIKFIEMAWYCQHIWQSLKKTNQNKFILGKVAEQQKTFKSTSTQRAFNSVQAAMSASSFSKPTILAVASSKPATSIVVVSQS